MPRKADTPEPERIWIIGASSGLGEALACEYADRGAVLHLSARNEPALNSIGQRLGSEYSVHALDVSDIDSLLHAAKSIESQQGVPDRIILLAAAYQPMALDELKPDTVAQIVNTNLIGTFNTLHAILQTFTDFRSLQFAICGSVAGYLGLPNGQPYSATKAAIINLTESLRVERPDIDVRLISPGFVRTGLTAKNDFKMPMLLEPEQAARMICDGLNGSAFEVHFPKAFTLSLKLLRLLPYSISLKLTQRLKK